MVSNGEYMPHPQTEQQQHVEYRVKELADEAAQKLGTTRRKFLLGTGGMAAALHRDERGVRKEILQGGRSRNV